MRIKEGHVQGRTDMKVFSHPSLKWKEECVFRKTLSILGNAWIEMNEYCHFMNPTSFRHPRK